MKVGDLIRHREAWTRNENDEVVSPRTDNAGWSGPMLVVERYPPPDESLFIALEYGERVVISEHEGLTEVEILNESTRQNAPQPV